MAAAAASTTAFSSSSALGFRFPKTYAQHYCCNHERISLSFNYNLKRTSAIVIRASSDTATAEAAAVTADEEEGEEQNASTPRTSRRRRRRRKPIVPRLKGIYLEHIIPRLKEEFNYTNVHQVPKLEKIVVNCGIGDDAQNAKALERAVQDIANITGQWPVKTRAKRAISSFKIKKGQVVGIAVTLRGEVMYNFLDRVINISLPRSRDFQGVNPYGFDGHGNYNLGVVNHGMFPEIDAEIMDKPIGLNVSIRTTAKTDNEAYRLLLHMGMPFNDGGFGF